MKCYELHESIETPCKKEECRYWIDLEKCKNCVIIGSKEGPMTLQSIGDIFGITRMRVCQIEKKVAPNASHESNLDGF